MTLNDLRHPDADPTERAIEIMAEAGYAAFLAGGHPSLDLLPSWGLQSEEAREHWRGKALEQYGEAVLRVYDVWKPLLRDDLFEHVAELKSAWSRALAEQVKAELHSDEDGTTSLAGKLGEAIADSSGGYSLEFITPEQLAQGIVDWLVGE